jgi:hypothetical protein
LEVWKFGSSDTEVQKIQKNFKSSEIQNFESLEVSEVQEFLPPL